MISIVLFIVTLCSITVRSTLVKEGNTWLGSDSPSFLGVVLSTEGCVQGDCHNVNNMSASPVNNMGTALSPLILTQGSTADGYSFYSATMPSRGTPFGFSFWIDLEKGVIPFGTTFSDDLW